MQAQSLTRVIIHSDTLAMQLTLSSHRQDKAFQGVFIIIVRPAVGPIYTGYDVLNSSGFLWGSQIGLLSKNGKDELLVTIGNVQLTGAESRLHVSVGGVERKRERGGGGEREREIERERERERETERERERERQRDIDRDRDKEREREREREKERERERERERVGKGEGKGNMDWVWQFTVKGRARFDMKSKMAFLFSFATRK